MKRRHVLGAFAAVAASIALAATGAVASESHAATAAGLSTPDAINALLTAKGVDPATVEWQTGRLNYAGPNCPGVGWNCTTSTKVVQLTTAGGQNLVECPGGGCVAVQNGPNNEAECVDASSGTFVLHKCVVAQTNGIRNKAVVRMLIEQTTGAIQDARQAVDATQTATEKNELHIFMTIRQSTTELGMVGTSSAAQKQDAHQAAFINQTQSAPTDDATGTAGNFLHVHMIQDQEMSGAATLQQQNTEAAPVNQIGAQTIDFDCAPFHKPAEPNQCVNVVQDSDGNTNLTQLHQTIDEDAVTSVTGVTTQTQGREDGGIEGFTELFNPLGVGQNVDKAHQVLKQRADRPGAPPTNTVQRQATDPTCCGTGTSIGAKASQEDVKQFVTQSASSPTAVQFAQLTGETTVLAEEPEDIVFITQDGPATQGSGCKVLHQARNNEGSSNFQASQASPCALVVVTTCASGPPTLPDDGFTILQDPEPDDGCVSVSNEEDDGNGDETELVFFPSSPTFGAPLAPLDFGEPEGHLQP